MPVPNRLAERPVALGPRWAAWVCTPSSGIPEPGPRHRACLPSRLACFRAGGKQLPVPLGDDLDGAVDDCDGGLIVNRVRRH